MRYRIKRLIETEIDNINRLTIVCRCAPVLHYLQQLGCAGFLEKNPCSASVGAPVSDRCCKRLPPTIDSSCLALWMGSGLR